MASLIGSLAKKSSYKQGNPLNVLSFATHERIDTNIALTGHNFFTYRAEGIKDWNKTFAAVPKNYTLLDASRGENQMPKDIDFDLILSQNKFGQMQVAKRLAAKLHLPLISLEHTLPMPNWGKVELAHLKALRGDLNIFISEYSRAAWGWGSSEADVIHHGIDNEVFKPQGVNRRNEVLSVVNDWINRDYCCGFNLWKSISREVPVRVVGDTPGLSKPAASVEELAGEYASAKVFLNTSLISPIPTSLLEAMSSACAVISTANCMIPEIIEHGVNGFISNNPEELRSYCLRLLADDDLAARLGAAARKTIIERFSLDKFVRSWNDKFEEARQIFYIGE